MKKHFALLGAILICAAGVAAGCGSSSSSNSSSSSGGSSGSVQSGGTVTPTEATNAKGNVTWCIGKDTTGAFSQVVSLYNQSHPGVHVKLLELPTSADQQRTQLTQRLQAKSSECDVLGMDVIWTAEFASQGWLKDVTPAIQARQNEFIPSTLNTAKINGKYWAVPFNTNAGLLYYNDKKVSQAPTTWQQVLQMAKTDGGFGFQGQAYEGLTVDFLEMLYSAGGSVLSPDGKSATIDSPQAQQVLAFLQQGMKDKAIPQANLTYMEEESRNAFQDGRVSILRNWPYVYSLARQATGAVQGRAAADMAGRQAGERARRLQPRDLDVLQEPGGALSFIDFATAPAAQKKFFIKSSLPAVLDADLQ